MEALLVSVGRQLRILRACTASALGGLGFKWKGRGGYRMASSVRVPEQTVTQEGLFGMGAVRYADGRVRRGDVGP